MITKLKQREKKTPRQKLSIVLIFAKYNLFESDLEIKLLIYQIKKVKK